MHFCILGLCSSFIWHVHGDTFNDPTSDNRGQKNETAIDNSFLRRSVKKIYCYLKRHIINRPTSPNEDLLVKLTCLLFKLMSRGRALLSLSGSPSRPVCCMYYPWSTSLVTTNSLAFFLLRNAGAMSFKDTH